MAAAAGNQLATLQWLRTPDAEQQWEVAKVAAKAAECADLSMLQWILEQQPEWSADSTKRVIEGAAGAADAIDKLIWLCHCFPADRLQLRYCFARASTKRGAVASLRWLASTRYPFRASYHADTACAAGQLAALRFLVEEARCPWSLETVRRAAVAADSAEMLQWSSSAPGAGWTTAQLSQLLAVACQGDKLHAAKWLKSCRCRLAC
jgi:hypothetical protein